MSRQQMGEKIPMSLYTAVKNMAIFYIQKKYRPLQAVKSAVCKILLESRAFRKDELEPMLQSL